MVDLQDCRVLFVDDVGFSRLIVSMGLEQWDLKVDTAESGAQALAILAKKSYDVVITDYFMPEMNGFEFYRQARKIQRISDDGIVSLPPFILLTAVTDQAVFHEAISLGFSHILSKPFQAEKVCQAIAGVLEDEEAELDSCRRRSASSPSCFALHSA